MAENNIREFIRQGLKSGMKELDVPMTAEVLDRMNTEYNSEEMAITALLFILSKMRNVGYPMVGQLRVATQTIETLLATAPNDEFRKWIREKVTESMQ